MSDKTEVVLMVLDMRPMLRGETDRIQIDYLLTPQLPDGTEPVGDARVAGVVTDEAGYMRLTLTAELVYHGECARCLASVDGVFSLDFERTVTTEGTIDEDKLEELADEYVVLNGNELDVDEPLREELLLGFPTRLLCSEDCEGLCPKCGRPKREGDCGCVLKEIDPRLAVLKNFFDKDQDEK
jgi:uncharacterized protein